MLYSFSLNRQNTRKNYDAASDWNTIQWYWYRGGLCSGHTRFGRRSNIWTDLLSPKETGKDNFAGVN